MELVLVKVYAAFGPVDGACRAAVEKAAEGAMGAVETPLVFLDPCPASAPERGAGPEAGREAGPEAGYAAGGTGADSASARVPGEINAGGLLRISFEGLYFPLQEVMAALEARLPPQATGRLDYLDLDNWTLTRYERRDGIFVSGTRGLNHVLDHSGH